MPTEREVTSSWKPATKVHSKVLFRPATPMLSPLLSRKPDRGSWA